MIVQTLVRLSSTGGVTNRLRKISTRSALPINTGLLGLGASVWVNTVVRSSNDEMPVAEVLICNIRWSVELRRNEDS